MLHPHTELKYVSPEIGYGVFATQPIPMGTMTWVKDELDRVIPKEDLAKFSPANLENFLKYTYRTSKGDYFFCWDLTRFVNHSYSPNTMITPLSFEIALRDISPGEEITNDYGTLNIIEPFACANGPIESRNLVQPDDLGRFYQKWDSQIFSAFKLHASVPQPLERFLTTEQLEELKLIKEGKHPFPSLLQNLYKED